MTTSSRIGRAIEIARKYLAEGPEDAHHTDPAATAIRRAVPIRVEVEAAAGEPS
jgi:hypothetical protein